MSLSRSASRPQLLYRILHRPGQRMTGSSRLFSTGPSDLSGINCIVTGASSGIGRSTAILLSRHGATCTLIGRNRPALTSSLDRLAKPSTSSTPHRVLQADISDPDFWKDSATIDSITTPCHVLVNAAGVAHSSLFVRTSHETIDRVMSTNLLGTTHACHSIVRRMLKNQSLQSPMGFGRGCIVNVASLLAIRGGKGTSVYAASKAGVVGLTRAMAAELGPLGIRVNCVLPGYIRTKMTDAMTTEAQAAAVASVPLKRLGTPEEVAQAILFLVVNGYANNCVLNLDGGLSAI